MELSSGFPLQQQVGREAGGGAIFAYYETTFCICASRLPGNREKASFMFNLHGTHPPRLYLRIKRLLYNKGGGDAESVSIHGILTTTKLLL